MRTSKEDVNLSHVECPPDPQLVAKGWERRFVTDPVRIKQAIEWYSSAGYEVRAEQFTSANLRDECGECLLVSTGCALIYNRKK